MLPTLSSRTTTLLLSSMASNRAASLGCIDTVTGQDAEPLFFVFGACPNMFCGMQAVMYSASALGEVDFWWVKPSRSPNQGGVEAKTLNKNVKGPHKNDPGRSKPFYQPLADLFGKECGSGTRMQRQNVLKGGVRLGLERVKAGEEGGREAVRAYLEQEGQISKVFLNLVWQEDWTSNPFARSKYIKGKIIYQKDPQALQFFARQYSIVDGIMTIAPTEDLPFESVVPGNEIKALYAD
mmetsp:Transcript_62126/g.133588  ORF Transcript_62126/g.133588 Transcript_62126/m.133588 type:complete len:238 (-) Transcript_62126:63-776(-)